MQPTPASSTTSAGAPRAATVLVPSPMTDRVMAGLAAADGLEIITGDPGARRDQVRGIAASHLTVDTDFLAQYPALEIISSQGVGYDSIDAEACAKAGVMVTNTPGVLDDEVADTTMGLLLMTVRRLGAAERYLRAGKWVDAQFGLSDSLAGKRVGLVGMGRIGTTIAQRCGAFGLPVAYYSRNPKDVEYDYVDDLVTLAQRSDILIVIVPGGAATAKLVDADVLAALGPDGYLINVARGSVVDEDALVTALRDGTIAGAGLDVFENEPQVPPALLDLDQVVLLPHVGSATEHTRGRMGDLVVQNLESWFGSGQAVTPVPECDGVRPRG